MVSVWTKSPSAPPWCPRGIAKAGGPVRPIDVTFAVRWELVKCAVCTTALRHYTAHCGSQFRVVRLGLVRICGVGTRQDGLWLLWLPFAVVQSCRTLCWLLSQQDRLYVRAVTNVFWFGLTAENLPSHPQPSLNKGHICSTFVSIYFNACRMQRGDDKYVSTMIKCRLI
jgi:hypothetical protein